jgi:2-polyprenyl-3-methyl-5-hydroxy-6-metoxy-1,4-benzoquinol methylase
VSNWNPKDYDGAWTALAEAGRDPHGEVAFVERAVTRLGVALDGPVLDAGCGTGRVAIELARRGYAVQGTDIDTTMLGHAREKAPELTWHLGNLASLAFATTFPVIVMAGNVILFADPSDRPAVLRNAAAHLRTGGLLIAGFQLQRPDGRRVTLTDWDSWASSAGVDLVERFFTWDEDAFTASSDYVVSVHRRKD